MELIRKENKPRVYRRITFAVLIAVAAVLQSTGGFSVFGIRILLLLPLTVCIGMFERETFGTAFGVFAGMLWDLNASHGDGFNALSLAFICFSCGLMMTYVMRNNLATALLLGTFFIALRGVSHWLFFTVFDKMDFVGYILLTKYLPEVLLNILLIVPVYYVIRAVMKHSKISEGKELAA